VPSVEIIAVGTELLLGQLLDTNTKHVATALADAGLNVFATHAVGDNRERIAAAIARALERADGVITTGGLGPTIDDLTKEAVCDVLHCQTQVNQPALAAMQEIFARSGREMRENNRKQAELPRGAVVLVNHNGTAPGFIAQTGEGKFVACMPGVPSEMKPMLAEQLMPWLRERFGLRDAIYTRTLHTINIAESEIDHRIDDLFRTLENPKIAVLAHEFRCDVKIMAKASSPQDAEKLIQPIEDDIKTRLSGHVFGVDEQTLASVIHELLQKSGKTLSVAESCTGGLVCAALTAVPGSSKSFMGGIIAYDNAVKAETIGVSNATLQRAGAVSEETALEMAHGVRARLKTDIGVATTGIAGPSGGSAEKPVGLVWLAIADGSSTHATKLQLRGERTFIQARAATATLGVLWRALARLEPI
jgi:nicotinamide-nucleotide amidase